MGRSKKRKAKAKAKESSQERDDHDLNNIAQILQSLSTHGDHQPEPAGAPSLDLNLTLRPPQPQSSPHQQHAMLTTPITPSSTSAFKKWSKPTSAAAAASSSSTNHSSASSFQRSPNQPPPALNPIVHDPVYNISMSLYNDLVQMLLGPPLGNKQLKISSSVYKKHSEAKIIEAQESDQGNSKILPQPLSSTSSAFDSAHTVDQSKSDYQIEKQNSESSGSGTDQRAPNSLPSTAVGRRFDHLPPPSLSYNDASEIVNTFVEAIGKVQDASDMTLPFMILEAGLKLPRCIGLLELYQSSGSMDGVVNYVMDYFKSWEAKKENVPEESQVDVKVSSEHSPEKDLQSLS